MEKLPAVALFFAGLQVLAGVVFPDLCSRGWSRSMVN